MMLKEAAAAAVERLDALMGAVDDGVHLGRVAGAGGTLDVIWTLAENAGGTGIVSWLCQGGTQSH